MKKTAQFSITLILLAGFAAYAFSKPASLTETQKVTHVLNRIAFGPRPGDVERVRGMGIGRYIDEQLRPERIDDRAAEARLDGFPSLQLSASEMLERYPDQQTVARALGIDRQSADQAAMRQQVQAYIREKGLGQPQKVIQELVGQRIVRAVTSERQLQEVLTDFWFNHFNVFIGKNNDRYLTTAYEMKAIRPNVLGKFKDLLMATAKSSAMMVYLDNQTSVAPDPRVAAAAQRGKGRNQGINENYARELMELHTMGVDGGYTQRDVQEVARAFTGWSVARQQDTATARNAKQQQDATAARNAKQQQQDATAARNAKQQQQDATAARNAKQQQQDATAARNAKQQQQDAAAARNAKQTARQAANAARGGRGQTGQQAANSRNAQIPPNAAQGEFVFRPQMHDTGEKTVLGQRIRSGGGIEDGEQVIDILVHHPSTARFIAGKLVRRFVSDTPPESLVDRVANTFTRTDGDIREMLRTIFTSEEFYAPETFQSKAKSPLEFAASAIRALDGATDGGQALAQSLERMGQPLYRYQAPTGFPDRADFWLSNGLVLERINFAIALTSNRIQGTRVDLSGFSNAQAASLHVGSPEFQKR